jgi:hypothetical protein
MHFNAKKYQPSILTTKSCSKTVFLNQGSSEPWGSLGLLDLYAIISGDKHSNGGSYGSF